MAAPATTERVAPAGIRLDDGYQTLIAFALDPDVSFWEKTVKPPGLDGGDAIDTTTMHNVTWRTFAARQLKTLTNAQTKVSYDPNVYNNILSNLINREGAITVHFPDGSTLDFFGFLRTFDPQPLTKGQMPRATVAFTPTNYDPANNVEAGPVLTSVAGT